MPKRNRVTPHGDIVAIDLRGAWLGNRGILHEGEEIVAFHRHRLWITCALQHRDWRLPQWQPHHFTVLFFHDEAVSLAAGHRPCALCRRADYDRFTEIWAGLHPGQAGADAIDAQLHTERVDPVTRAHRLHAASFDELPDGAFVLRDGMPGLVLEAELLRWTAAGYTERTARPAGAAVLVTPPSLVAVLGVGWTPDVPLFHSSARRE